MEMLLVRAQKSVNMIRIATEKENVAPMAVVMYAWHPFQVGYSTGWIELKVIMTTLP